MKIKDCPYCGSVPQIAHRKLKHIGTNKPYMIHTITCSECSRGVLTVPCYTVKGAVAMWNTGKLEQWYNKLTPTDEMVLERVELFKLLEDGWYGNGEGNAYNHANLNRFVEWVKEHKELYKEAPRVYPVVDKEDSLFLEWYSGTNKVAMDLDTATFTGELTYGIDNLFCVPVDLNTDESKWWLRFIPYFLRTKEEVN